MDDQTNQIGAGPGEAERAQGSGAVALGRGGTVNLCDCGRGDARGLGWTH
jgi:hypothetical protein